VLTQLSRRSRHLIPSAPNSLAKSIPFYQLFAIGFGTMIGVGWIIVAGSWILTAGPGGAIVAFAVGAVAVLVVGLAYSEMGSTFPFSGGEIVYVYEGLGTPAAFFIGWLLTLTFVAVCAFEIVASAWIVTVLLPNLDGPVLYRILGSNVTVGALVIGFSGLAALAAVNFRGGLASARLQNIATGLKVTATIVFVVAALAHGSSANRAPWFARDSSGSTWGAIVIVLATVPVWYGGFNTMPQALGEVADVSRLRNLATVMSLAIVAGFVFFACVIVATASPVPRAALAHSDFPVAAALFGAFSSPWPGRAVLAAGLMGIITSWNACIFSGARVLFCLARARIIPGHFSRVNARFGSPGFAVLFICLVSAPIALLGKNSLVPIINLIGINYATGYLLVAVSLYRLRNREPLLERPYRVPGHPYITAAAIVIAAMFVLAATYGVWHASSHTVPSEFIALAAWLLGGYFVWRLATGVRARTTPEERRALISVR